MDISIESNGSKNTIDDLVNALSNDVGSLIDKIIKTAKEICNDPDCKRIVRKKVESSGNEVLANIEFMDRESVDCMIKAIKQYLQDMPEGIDQIFNEEINRLEELKKDFNQ